ncbi:MAG: hypothetical protein E7596_02335 [Ruminococcaceae bacterium]|nr:hypothetical protein [Oscillospiraceae bacterium]
MINVTKQRITFDAIKKYERISDKKKLQYLNDQKKFIKLCFFSSMSGSFLLGIICLFAAIFNTEYFVMFMFLCSIFILTGVILAVTIIIKLRAPNKILILNKLKKVLKRTYRSMSYHEICRHKPYVKQHSSMCKDIEKLNSQYLFDRITCREHRYNEHLNNKRQFDNFNYDNWIFSLMDKSPNFFENFQKIYEKNAKEYNEYSAKYSTLNDFKEEIDIEDLDIEYEIFNYIEREIFFESKLPEIERPSIYLKISYTSPAGRNHYSDSHIFTYFDLLRLVNKKKERDEELIAELRYNEFLLERKQDEKNARVLAMQEKRNKERKLKELEKLEKQLLAKEQELNEKEKDFLEATKEHMYTSKVLNQQELNNNLEKASSLTEKFRLLRKKFDDGEITYEEYKCKRKELM